jgi:hypothetical protein
MSSVFSSVVHAIGFGRFFKADERDLTYPSDLLNDLEYDPDQIDALTGLSKKQSTLISDNPYGVGFSHSAKADY